MKNIEYNTAQLVKIFINRSQKPQGEICSDIGLPRHSNALSLFKSGKSPLPISRCKALADSCECTLDEKKLLIATSLKEYLPEVVDALDVFMDGKFTEEIRDTVHMNILIPPTG